MSLRRLSIVIIDVMGYIVFISLGLNVVNAYSIKAENKTGRNKAEYTRILKTSAMEPTASIASILTASIFCQIKQYKRYKQRK